MSGCAQYPACEEIEGPGELTVDTSSTLPVFSWSSGEPANLLQMDTWLINCKTEEPCLLPPITYGEYDEQAVMKRDYNEAQPLESGVEYEVRVSAGCDDGNRFLDTTAVFVAP
jgi:hypothetical protein